MTEHDLKEMSPREAQSFLMDAISGRLGPKLAKMEENKPALERLLAVLEANAGKGKHNDNQEKNLAAAIDSVRLTIKLVGPGNASWRDRAQQTSADDDEDLRTMHVLSSAERRQLNEVNKKREAELTARGFLYEIRDEIDNIESNGIEVRHPSDKNRVVSVVDLRENAKNMALGFKKLLALKTDQVRPLFGDINGDHGESEIGRICKAITRARDFRERYRKTVLRVIEKIAFDSN